ncbi:MAG: hypothetical protein OXI67_07345 [Candidatus Poribacteria bacterium]|nr:hypothetical protein [Candidatus Poribacteria bacterium]
MYHTLNTPQTGILEVIEEYDYYDFPTLFSCKSKETIQDDEPQLYMVLFADRSDDYDVWLYAEVTLDYLNLIRSAKVSLHDTFASPEKDRILKVDIPRNSSVEYNSNFILPSELSEDILPTVNDFLDIEYTPLSIQSNLVESENWQHRNTVTIKLNSIGGADHEVSAYELGKAFVYFQSTMDVIEMVKQKYNKVTRSIKESIKFYATPFAFGSLEIKLVCIKESPKQANLFDPHHQKDTISEFFKLIKSKNSKSDMKDVLTGLGLRTTSEYKKLLAALYNLNTDITLSWESPERNEDAVVVFSKAEIPELLERLTVIEVEQEEPFTIEGKLVGLSLPSKRFVLHKSENGETIKGAIEKEYNRNIENATISQTYNATIKEIASRNKTTDTIEKIENILLDLNEV